MSQCVKSVYSNLHQLFVDGRSELACLSLLSVILVSYA